MNLEVQNARAITRRFLLGRTGSGLGAAALASLLAESANAASKTQPERIGGLDGVPHFAPKAKRVIYLFQSGGPSQLDLFDYKPQLQKHFGNEVPRSVYPDERKTTMTAAQKSFATAPSVFKFAQHGRGGTWMSELLPHTAGIADEMCVIRSMHTEAINHDPAITFFQTGSQIPGRPSIGSWLSYGLGSMNRDLPTFVAMSSRGSGSGQPIYDRLWGSGFLPSLHQGVKFRNQGSPVLDIDNPRGIDRRTRRAMLDLLRKMNELHLKEKIDPEIQTRIEQYELAFRMQTSVPELLDLSRESKKVLALYGPSAQKKGTYAYNCLIARRLAERGVRCIQLFHQGWDHHGGLPKNLRRQCRDTDQPTAALVKDLKQRGMLDDTLIVWGGEFGRTVYSQGRLTKGNYGRDHHPNCFTKWMAGGGVRGGMTYGETDDYSVNVTRDGVHVHDLHATMLHLLGIDHRRLTFPFQGRDFRLTDVHGRVMKELLA
jgi:hypothetical protein